MPSLHRIALSSALAAALLAPPGTAQQAPPPSIDLPYVYDSGEVSSPARSTAVVISTPVRVEGAQWLRLQFQLVQLAGEAEDGSGSILRISSYRDGAIQEMNAIHVGQWGLTSAYFNGDTVQVEVEAQPGRGVNRLILRAVTAGLPFGPPETQCGPTDDRVLSFEGASARAMPVGCSAWIFDDCNRCMGTAGHCSGSSLQVMQFNVPLSTAGGGLVNPPPQHQYSVDVSSKQSTSGGVGNDWGYFGCFPNSNTGLTPFQAQGAAYTLAASPPPFNPSHVIRVTGYGTDSSPAQNNQVQQTSTGPYFSFSGSTVRHQVDTQGGNSGSPVIWQNGGGVVIGVHTHGGCNFALTNANAGTGTNHGGWTTARANPKGVCSTNGTASTYCTAKLNSAGCMPAVGTSGLPKVSGGPGSFTISASQLLNQKSGLLYYGFLPNNAPFQGGFLCVASPITRTPLASTNGSPSGTNCTGSLAFDMGALIASGADPALECGAIVYAQFWSRDPGFAPPNNTSLSQGVKFQIGK
jgi:hypothetical protein